MKFDLLYHLISPVTGKLKILLNLGNGLLKTTNDGELSIAIPDVDFATSTTLEQIKSDTEFYKTQAQIASGTATNAASVATTAAEEASTAAINANTSMATAMGAVISAAASAQSASDSANSAADSAAQAVQNIPTFNYPLLKTTNTLSCLYDNLTIGLDASNRLKVISGSSQWTTSDGNIFYNVNGSSVGIGTATPSTLYKLDVNGNINVQGTANTQQFNACDTSAIAALKVRNVNIIGANANLRIFRYGGTSNNPGVELLWNLTTPAFSTDYTYLWDFYIASDGSFRFRCRKPALSLDYFVINTSGSIGIGTATPSSSYKLDVNGNINCTEIYRSGTSLATTLETKQDTLTAGTSLLGIGTSITALNATNITSGTLSTAYGGTGVTTGLTVLNPANLSSAVTVAKGGTGAATLTSGQLLIGNGTAAVLQSANLAWNNISNVLNVSSNININGNVNQAQSLYFRGTDYNLGIAGAAGNFSSSAVQNDMILRTLSGTNLILQSGFGSSALKINNNNYVALNKILQLSVVPADNRTVTETTIMNNGGVVGGAFGGDVYLSSYWGVAIGLNNGGFTNGIGGGNNSQSIIPGQSAFTVNLRSSASSTSFDKTLFTVLPSGNVGIGKSPSYKLDVNGDTKVTGYLYNDGNISVQGTIYMTNNRAVTNYWQMYINSSNSNFTFNHYNPGSSINSNWWFNGTQTDTQSEISDYRVKKEIKEIDNPLDKLMLLKPKEYKLCQDKDYNKKFGLIAQDIYETDLNEFVVNNEEEYVANIFANGTYNNKLITSDKIIDDIKIDDEIKLVFSNDGENKEYIIDGNDGPFENRYKRRYVKVKSIIDDYTFEISDELDIKEESFLIYGKKVNDFHKLDYHSMYALNIAATQELFKIVQDLKTRI